MPQLNFHDFGPQLVWLVIAFVVLYLVMTKLAVPAISDTLARRQSKIQGDLDAAEKANNDMRVLVAAYEKRLTDAREQARQLQREQAEADSVAAIARLNEVGERLGSQIAEAEKRIAADRAAVFSNLEQMAREIAQSAYAKLVGQTADEGALSGKVAAAVKGNSR